MTHTHRVAARTPGTLSGGRPYAPGDLVTPDPERDAHLVAAGALVPLAAAAASTDDGDGLDPLSRDELDALAAVEGVTDPEKLRSKAAVIDAIRAARTAQPPAPDGAAPPKETPSQEAA